MKELLRKRWFKLLLVVVAIGAGVGAWYLARPVYHIRISRETTYLTGPLRPDGTVDYLAAIEANQREGVTPENNAAVLLLQAFGPEMLYGQRYESLCVEWARRVGTTLPDGNGAYLVDLTAYVRSLSPQQRGDLGLPKTLPWSFGVDDKRVDAAMTRPWKADEFPEIAAYLDASERPLALVVAASERRHLYMPLLSPKPDGRVFDVGSIMPQMRTAGRALVARAMTRLANGETEGAFSDLLACHHLAGLAGYQCGTGSWLVAAGVEWLAYEGDKALLAHAKPGAAVARKMLAEFRAVPRYPSMPRALEFQRLQMLDAVALVASEGIENATLRFQGKDVMKPPRPERSVDWNPAMLAINSLIDRLQQASMLSSSQGRRAAQSVYREVGGIRDRLSGRSGGWAQGIARDLGWRLKVEEDGRITNDPMSVVAYWFPGSHVIFVLADARTMRMSLAECGFALAAFYAEKGRYPAKLDEIVPDYMPSIPIDSFSGQPLVYRAVQKGYILYSVGANETDDGGIEGQNLNEGDIVLSVSE